MKNIQISKNREPLRLKIHVCPVDDHLNSYCRAFQNRLNERQAPIGVIGGIDPIDLTNPAFVTESADADMLVVPVSIGLLDDDYIERRGGSERLADLRIAEEFAAGLVDHFPRMRTEKHRHVFFQFGDRVKALEGFSGGVIFKHSASRVSDSLAYPYRPFAEFRAEDLNVPILNTTLDVSFRGLRHGKYGSGLPVRESLLSSVADLSARGYSACIEFVEDLELEVREYNRGYIDQILGSRFVFCPRGFGLTSIRFFETLRLGRIPILLADDAKLPLESILPYDRCVIRVPERHISLTGQYIDEFIGRTTLSEASQTARECSHILQQSQNTEFLVRALTDFMEHANF